MREFLFSELRDELAPAADAEFSVGGGELTRDGSRRRAPASRDVGVRKTAQGELHDSAFGFGERAGLGRFERRANRDADQQQATVDARDARSRGGSSEDSGDAHEREI